MGITIVGVILLALFIVPFAVLQISKHSKKRRIKKDNEPA
ncbi:MAG: hypothetical protein BWY47_00994 [Bacteroidetes bacterium ADurb.Bin302]|nr:MAG: hypothetical protein BWY47_00994 [Bacteroidetes bacterium ADurb.Bin302]